MAIAEPYNAAIERILKRIDESRALIDLYEKGNEAKEKFSVAKSASTSEDENKGFALIRFMKTGLKEGPFSERIGKVENLCRICAQDHQGAECTNEPVCFSCGKTGHDKRACPQAIKLQQPEADFDADISIL